jgi:hypothetical protein
MDRETFLRQCLEEDPDATPMEYVFETPDRVVPAHRVRKIVLEIRQKFQDAFAAALIERDPAVEQSEFVASTTRRIRDDLCKKPKYNKFARANDHKRIFEMITSIKMKAEDFAKILTLIDLREQIENGSMTEKEGMDSLLGVIGRPKDSPHPH